MYLLILRLPNSLITEWLKLKRASQLPYPKVWERNQVFSSFINVIRIYYLLFKWLQRLIGMVIPSLEQ